MAPETVTEATLANAVVRTTLSTTDLDRARDFYGKKLGLRVEGGASGEPAIRAFAGGGTELYIYARQDPPKAENTVASFHVEDVPATVASLRSRGVAFQEYDTPDFKTVDAIATMPDGTQVAWFTDPDGNILAVGRDG